MAVRSASSICARVSAAEPSVTWIDSPSIIAEISIAAASGSATAKAPWLTP